VLSEARAGFELTARDAVGNGDTGTNLQEADVDEADVAKTDGQQVVSVAGADLVVTDVSGDQPVMQGRLTLPPRLRSGELLLDGDTAIVVGWTYLRRGGWHGLIWSPEPTTPSRTLIARVDLTDPHSPELVGLDRIEGELMSAREHDGTVRLVVSSAPELPFVTPGRGRGVREALAHNRDVVRSASAQDWLPQTSTLGVRGKTPVYDCAEVTYSSRSSDPGTVSILTLAAGDNQGFAATGIAAEADVVYASSDRLYVASQADDAAWGLVESRVGPEPARDRTQLHAFDTSGTQTSYVASGFVPGTVEDRWSMSEYEGLLRVAAMRGSIWSPRQTVVSVLEESGDRLRLVGHVGGLGRREQIKAVRWFGDMAVVVTFRQVDPLYVLDLADPARPRLSGELKVPGYSGYLHPLGEGMLLGIGQEATLRGVLTRPQAATFDLTEPSKPRQVDTAPLGSNGASAVEEDARAFTYLPGERLAFVPVGGWWGTQSIVPIHVGPTGASLRTADPIQLGRHHDAVRVLPLTDSRVAVVGGGQVLSVLDVSDL